MKGTLPMTKSQEKRRGKQDETPYSAWYTASILLLVGISNQWSRYLLPYLYAVSAPPGASEAASARVSLQWALGLSSTQYGLLAGTCCFYMPLQWSVGEGRSQ